MNALQRILLLCVIFTGILALVGWYGYSRGAATGAASIQAKWDADKVAAQKTHDALVQQLAEQDAAHNAQQEKTAHELAQAQESHAADLAAQHSEYEQRLLQSARRGDVYRAQAQASAASARDLASHAAELDRALEEGVELVGELQETLGLREQQLKLLGDQILNDRKLMEPSTPSSSPSEGTK